MRISDWSSDVCSSDLQGEAVPDQLEIARPELRVALCQRHMEQYDRRQDEAEDHRKRTGERCEHGARARQAIAWKSLVAARSMVIAGVTAAAAFEQDQQEDEPDRKGDVWGKNV